MPWLDYVLLLGAESLKLTYFLSCLQPDLKKDLHVTWASSLNQFLSCATNCICWKDIEIRLTCWIFIFWLLHATLALHYVPYPKTSTQNVLKSLENSYMSREGISRNCQLWKIHFGTPGIFSKSMMPFAQGLVSCHLSLNYYTLWPHCISPSLRKPALSSPSFQQHECPLPLLFSILCSCVWTASGGLKFPGSPHYILASLFLDCELKQLNSLGQESWPQRTLCLKAFRKWEHK